MLLWLINTLSIYLVELLNTINYFYIENLVFTDSILNITFNDYVYIKSDDHISLNHALLDLPWPASEKMNSLVLLYLEVSYTVLFVFFIVCVFLLETLILHNTSEHKKEEFSFSDNKEEEESFNAYPVHFTPEEEHLIDMFVIIIPTIVVLQIVIPTLGYLYNEEFLYYDSYISFDVNIIGNQWFWTYEYIIDICSTENFTNWNNEYIPREKEQLIITFDSILITDTAEYRLLSVDNALVLPVNTNILLSFTSRDVIHSWALPQMGIKVDCIPGRITHTLFSSFSLGVFYGQCSELCGPLHGFMPISVEVVSFDDFFIWVMIKYKTALNDLGVYTDLIYTKEVFNLLGLHSQIEIDNMVKVWKQVK